MQLICTRTLLRIFFVIICVYIFIFIAKQNGISKNLSRFNASYPSEKSEGVFKLPRCRRNNQAWSKNVKIILLWSSLFDGMEFLSAGKNTFSNHGCPEIKCEITSDRSLLMESDAVVFHIRTLNLSDMPNHRYCDQKWVFFSMESPIYSYMPHFKLIDTMFNWTMTYRFDSDVTIGYGNIIKRTVAKKNASSRNFLTSWKTKKKIVVWMVSHCSTSSNREGYVQELQNYMDVDIIGECGIAVCPFNKTDLCLKSFARTYKFYLAFENSICDGYITEKLYRILQYDIVPIVLGGGNYDELLPPKSYINAMDFTPQNLARYLRRVSSNSSLYFEYFKWKTSGHYVVKDTPMPCDLCKKLHSERFVKSSLYENITNWWVKKSNCRTWQKPVSPLQSPPNVIM